MQKIVTIGGGTGHYQILRGLKNRDCEITAIVNVCDNGGHSGNLRDEYGVLPPGDSRQCLIALANEESSNVLRRLFEHRFKKENSDLSVGNFFIAGLEDLYGNPTIALKEAGKILGISGKVIPVTEDSFHINAKLEDGSELKGQTEISYTDSDLKIIDVYPSPTPSISREAAEAIRDADKIVICPGDLYGSIIPNFLIKGIKEAIEKSNAKIVYICNLVTKQGNYGHKASDFVNEIERYLEVKKIDKIILNTKPVSNIVLKKYLDEKSKLVEDDLNDERIARAELIDEYISGEKIILRHHPIKTAREIINA